MTKKYYAVRNIPKAGIYETWKETEELVKGVKGVQYKSFEEKEDAIAFLNDMNYLYAVREGLIPGIYRSYKELLESVQGHPDAVYARFDDMPSAVSFMGEDYHDPSMDYLTKEDVDAALEEYFSFEADYDNLSRIEDFDLFLNETKIDVEENPVPKNKVVAYVDGSFNSDTKVYSSGIVFLVGDRVKLFHFNGNDPAVAESWQIGGEIIASKKAMLYALALGYKEIDIRYDLAGLKEWATRGYDAKTELSQEYRRFTDYISNTVKVNFVKIKSHTGNHGNELADILAGLHTK